MHVGKGSSEEQKDTQKAADLTYSLMDLNSKIEVNLWISAFISIIVDLYKQNDITLEEFKQDMTDMMAHYERNWDR